MNVLDDYVSFDTETTGFDAQARIVEIALVHFKGGEPVEEWSTLLYPDGVDWENANVKKAMEVNKIDRATLEGKPKFEDVIHRIHLHFRASDFWVAHNTDFDLRMINQEYQRAKGTAFPMAPKLSLCTMLLSRKIHSHEKGHKLENTAARWGVKPDGAHRAASDAITCGRILHAMRGRNALPAEFDDLQSFQKHAQAQFSRR